MAPEGGAFSPWRTMYTVVSDGLVLLAEVAVWVEQLISNPRHSIKAPKVRKEKVCLFIVFRFVIGKIQESHRFNSTAPSKSAESKLFLYHQTMVSDIDLVDLAYIHV
ncbi:hypothetical protein GCM10023183_15510 [Nibribacter koreensis]|uniref:Uncharacterized protein n=1 Tax=Nibribacter koreensis TaxID=1084519 RepID=A0ABP8FGS6_9BACT